MSIIIKTIYNKNDKVWVIESFYKEHPRIIQVNVDNIMGQTGMPEGQNYRGMCDLSSDKLEITYLLSNGWFATEDQLFPTINEAVEAFNNNDHKKFIS